MWIVAKAETMYTSHMDTDHLQQENAKLKELNAFKTDVISISAHELRTSLSALKWILKMFMDNDVGELTLEQQSLMKKAFDSNERMIGLVNEMLSVNHTDEVNLTYELEKTHIEPIIDTVVFDFIGEAFKRGIEVLFLKPETPMPEVYIDIAKIRVVIQGLLENAIKYSDTGDKVFISLREKEGMLEIAIKDNGIGIPLEEQEHIFEKFFRARNAKERISTGSGFGLFTAKRIVEHHNGTLGFASNKEKGTTFFLTLPLAK